MGFSAGSTQNISEPCVVKTDAGLVSGIVEEGLRVYLGIPFAAPPVGDLRWKPPAPVELWDGVKETKAFSAGPPSHTLRIR